MMGSQFVGKKVFLSVNDSNRTRLRGLVSEVTEDQITLINVLFFQDGRVLNNFRLAVADILDVRIVPDSNDVPNATVPIPPPDPQPHIHIILRAPDAELTLKDLSQVNPVNRENIYEDELSRSTHLNIQLERAQFGVYNNEAAALLAFRFIFQYRSGKQRITAANINVQFQREGPGSAPYVVALAPEALNGGIFEEQYPFAESGEDSPGVSIASVGSQAKSGNPLTRQHMMSLRGVRRSSSAGTAVYDRVVWDCEETRKKAKGIIPRSHGAVIVKCDSRFSATFDVNVKLGNWVSGLKFQYENLIGRGKNCPVVFDREKPYGEPIQGISDFRQLVLQRIAEAKSPGQPLSVPGDNQMEELVRSECASGQTAPYLAGSSSLDTPYYHQVHILLLYWEDDDLGCRKEVDKVRDTFEKFFNYRTQTFLIPTRRSQASLQKELSDFILHTMSKSGLVIVYYAGHGDPDDESDERVSKLIWAAKEEGGPTLNWTDIQRTLLSAEGDVLLVLDCCHASWTVRSLHDSSIEVLAACARNIKTPAVGKNSFTTALISELKRVARKGISISSLPLWEIQNSLPEHFIATSPVYDIETRPKLHSVARNVHGRSSYRPIGLIGLGRLAMGMLEL